LLEEQISLASMLLGAKDLDWNFAKYIFKKKHGVEDPFSTPKSKLKLNQL
jgi:glutathione peroxidase-family protein